MTYYLFEKDLTTNHVSYHYCFLDCKKVYFPKKSKIQKDYAYICDVLERKLGNVKKLQTFHKAITPQNKFVESSYFHFSVSGISNEEYQLINSVFKIKVKNRYGYFTKLINDAEKETNFKCGFLLHEFDAIDHKMKSDAKDVAKILGGGAYNVLYAFDYDKDGNVIHDNINIELLPNYSTDTFLTTKQKLLEYFPNIDRIVFDKYDSIFESYYPQKFHFHFKVKLYNDRDSVVKFYRTYNSKNPYVT